MSNKKIENDLTESFVVRGLLEDKVVKVEALKDNPMNLYLDTKFLKEDINLAINMCSLILGLYSEIYSNFDKCYFSDLKKSISKDLESLNSKEREVLLKRYGLDCNQNLTLAGIGKKMNLTRERIRQIEESALKKLRLNDSSEILKNIKLVEYLKLKVKALIARLANSSKKKNDIDFLPSDFSKELKRNGVNSLKELRFYIEFGLLKVLDIDRKIMYDLEKLSVEDIEDYENDVNQFSEFSNRTRNVLIRNGITSIKKLRTFSESELIQIDYLGKGCLEEIKEKLKQHNN